MVADFSSEEGKKKRKKCHYDTSYQLFKISYIVTHGLLSTVYYLDSYN